ncbi:protein B4 [Clarias gariepinus]|uniref:protein B4 n=1 Tax=Clarias gariepinus TaxID=13013 RepID=UPI00234D7F31|nr:protein B4 [Clarias gariepinus]
MGPKKAAAEVSSPPSTGAEDQLMEEQKEDSPVVGTKAVRKASPHPTTMEMLKEALMELDQRKGVSAQAIRAFIKEKYTTVDETRLKTMVRKALVKGIDSGVFVRPANSATTTGAQGRFRLAVRKPAKSKEAKENANPNVSKAKEPKVKMGDVKTKKTKSAAVEGDKPKKTKKNDVSASKVAPAKKPKAKRAAGETSEGESEPKTQKKSKASKGEGAEKSGAKKGGRKAAQKAEGDVSPASEGEQTEVQEGGAESVAPVQKRGGKKAGQKAEDGQQNGTKSSGKKGKKAAEK